MFYGWAVYIFDNICGSGPDKTEDKRGFDPILSGVAMYKYYDVVENKYYRL